jgi:hypothetical protein
MAYAKGRRDITRHFMRNPELVKYFPLLGDRLVTSDEGESSQRILQGDYSGAVQKLVQRVAAPYGFMSCGPLGSVYFNEQSLLDETNWGLLTKGTKVNFDVVFSREPFVPRAINLQVDSR